mmetsp:Transcript_10459/g.25848  ORF Transcript_10459/g.25848 Transcript_10459/m.25848 type:complete len:234 (+) Transcript_10459:315-1016(+)
MSCTCATACRHRFASSTAATFSARSRKLVCGPPSPSPSGCASLRLTNTTDEPSNSDPDSPSAEAEEAAVGSTSIPRRLNSRMGSTRSSRPCISIVCRCVCSLACDTSSYASARACDSPSISSISAASSSCSCHQSPPAPGSRLGCRPGSRLASDKGPMLMAPSPTPSIALDSLMALPTPASTCRCCSASWHTRSCLSTAPCRSLSLSTASLSRMRELSSICSAFSTVSSILAS